MAIWTFIRLTLREASRSRLLLLVGVLTLAYLGLIAWGMSKLAQAVTSPVNAIVSGAGLELMAFFLGSFMLTLLAVFVSGHSTHQDGDSGLLQAVLTKPVRRFDVLAGRWLASALLLTVWVTVFTAGVVWGVGLEVGYYPPNPVAAAALLLLQALLVLSLRLLFGTVLGTLASGILPLLLFGLGWMGGLVEMVGRAVHVPSMVTAGIATSLVIPTDAVWRGASYFLLPQLAALAALGDRNPAQGNPFVSLQPIATPMVVWAVLYVLAMFLIAARVFARRDL